MDGGYISKERIRQTVMAMRLIDDNYMKVFFEDRECTEFMLRIILNMPELKVVSVKTEYNLPYIHGHSARIDVMAEIGDNGICAIEIQKETGGAGEMRARRNSSLIDANAENPGKYGSELLETYVIFITENDFIGAGLPIYHINRYIEETGALFNDKAHIIYVNNKIQDDTALGKLMHDFMCSDPADMSYDVLSERARFLKNTEEGVTSMCAAVESLCNEAAVRAAETATRAATEKANKAAAFRMMRDGAADDKITDYLNISQSILDGYRREYNAG